jgi:hypothetical protein
MDFFKDQYATPDIMNKCEINIFLAAKISEGDHELDCITPRPPLCLSCSESISYGGAKIDC